MFSRMVLLDMAGDYLEFVSRGEKTTPEDVPEDVLQAAVDIATRYGACPHCGTEQYVPHTPGHNGSWECSECSEHIST